jgi:crotonobetainyl-CoA:carnitine CoA-transferase CaiB-like acyl-CoA transferase
MTEPFLAHLRVVELGDRIATGLCGGLLQRLGAEVAVIAPPVRTDDPETKWPYIESLSAGKSWLTADAGDAAARIIAASDVAILSSDWCEGIPAELQRAAGTSPIVCDVTAFGSTGPLAGQRYSDALMQAFAGLAACTGDPEGAPVITRLPVAECSTAVYAAAGILAALRAGPCGRSGRHVEVAMFDTALTLLSTFLPAHFVGTRPARIGNRHPSMSPWNAYPAKDGWLLLCSASNDMWVRVCEVIGRAELALDPRFADMPGRVRHAEAVDACIRPWVAGRAVDACVEAFTRADVPCGPVVSTAGLLDDATLRARDALVRLEARSGHTIAVPGALIRGTPACGVAPTAPVRDTTAVAEARTPRTATVATAAAGGPRPALHGLRVLEMGNYTTAPLAARQLGALGADVVKLEPRNGELSRASPPHREGQSYFCTLSNSDKRSVVIDLSSEADRALFRQMLSRSDVFVENMKPGALARFGFGVADIAQRHPALVYCSVSGFGTDTPLAGRPAMDATIQGMAGVMDLTRNDDVPYKVGVSICDILGGEFALLAVLAGLEFRARTGKGTFIDLSMQELSAWLTQLHWNGTKHDVPAVLVACRDGHVLATGPDAPALRQMQDATAPSRDALAAQLATRGVRAVPVQSVSEVASHRQVAERNLIVTGTDRRGRAWPLLACPIRLAGLPAVERRALGAIGEDRADVLRDWNIEPGARRA